MKICSRCKKAKPFEEFHKLSRSKDGRQGKCKACAIDVMQEWKKANPEKYAAMNKSYVRNLAKHGLTVGEWESILEEIEGKCQICGKVMTKAYVDHDHSNGLVRGALCTHCNRGLGAFYDDPEIMKKAIEFVRNPPLAHMNKRSRHGVKADTDNAWLPGRAPRSKK